MLTILCRSLRDFDLRYKVNQTPIHTTMKLLTSYYLRNRKAKAEIKNTIDEFFQRETGVPEGALLSLILYNLYVSDLPDPQVRVRHNYRSLNYVYTDCIT